MTHILLDPAANSSALAPRAITLADRRWIVAEGGAGPTVLLLHGTGLDHTTWWALAPLLARHLRIVAPDLPGHGDSSRPSPARMSLGAMADDLSTLLAHLHCRPALILGHSAGAAIAAQLIVSGHAGPAGLVGIDPAIFLPSYPRRSALWPLAARVAASPAVAHAAARWFISRNRVAELLRGAGSRVPAARIDALTRLLARPSQVLGALTMMANWDVETLHPLLAAVTTPSLLLAGEHDPWYPPATVAALAAAFGDAVMRIVPATGHLSHEERPRAVAALVLAFAHRTGIMRRLPP